MKQQKKEISMERLINLLICLIGALLVCIGIFVTSLGTKMDTILVSVGASLIASAIVAFLSSIYIQRYRRAKEITEVWGIRSIEDKRATMNLRIDEEMKKAKEHYDLIAFGAKSLRDGNEKGVIDCLKRGVTFRFLTVNPNCEMLNIRDAQERKTKGSTAYSIRQLQEWVTELNKQYPGKAQIRFSRYLPNEFFCRVDNYIYVGPYQYGHDSQQMITTEYRNPGEGFLIYEGIFDKLWNDTDYCSDSY